MGIQLYGRWHLEVTKAIHSLENRFVLLGTASSDGDYPPTVGLDITADGTSWQLSAEYRRSSTDPWQPSAMMIDPGYERVDTQATIGAEDPLPEPDFEDIQWAARYLDDTMIEIPYRPYAIRPADLGQMPDGIFETALGNYYMGVRVTNRWGLPFGDTHVLDITHGSRADLAMRGIHISDAWTQAELAALGQRQLGTGVVLGPVVPGESRTVFFKVNVADASPRKHDVEFVCLNLAGMADPHHGARRIRKNIFVSRTTLDSASGELVCRVAEGTVRTRVRQFAFDRVSARRTRHKCEPTRPKPKDNFEELRESLRALLDGKRIDVCKIQRLLACYCAGGTDGHDRGDSGHIRDERWCYEPFLAFLTKFDYTVTPSAPYEGQYGPIPYDDPWWKVLLIIIAILLLIAGMLEEAADVAYHDEDLVIGSLGRFQADDVDAALCKLDTDRALSFLQVLDAQSDETSQNAVTALNGNTTVNLPIVSRAEVTTILGLPLGDPQRRVFKSGARSGLTHGLMTGLVAGGHSLVNWNLSQLRIDQDPAFGEPTSQGGDSGSIWVQTISGRPVALNHSGDEADAGVFGIGSLLDDVQAALNITIGL